jgi:hypothetical protein
VGKKTQLHRAGIPIREEKQMSWRERENRRKGANTAVLLSFHFWIIKLGCRRNSGNGKKLQQQRASDSR